MLHRAVEEDCKDVYMILSGVLFCHVIHPVALLRLAQQRDKGVNLESR